MATNARTGAATTRATVRERLRRVTDPELDESIVDLEYVDEIRLLGSRVHVTFTLPTAWCSPAFAWMMATDARDEVETLEGVTRCTVRLREHMHDDEITAGVNRRSTFGTVFPDADGGVDEIRATLDAKSRLARQYDAIDALREAGLTDDQIRTLTAADLTLDDETATVTLAEGAFCVAVDHDPIAAYRQRADVTGLLGDDHPELFRNPDGDPIAADRFDLVYHRSRLANVNMTGQGSVCDALNEARHAPGRPPLSR
ncbi:metal-sulfur cluster assembly factor [Halomarina oriensis]|uniref:DUF59 domain-containing protein n=1 Tax=Halomarina oriensis TaxID=671145 RepID=A0A6B0GQW2_9EURY|nr:iron-sulfur cluster assembly protein [Halomarina oriensis]MWG34515.1 DUF59 domain-containing protein [Halomarina oriensis]